jgi:hypothetical protein
MKKENSKVKELRSENGFRTLPVKESKREEKLA